MRVADVRPFEIQDLLPSDTRFKILVFAGDANDVQQRDRLQNLALDLERPDSFFRRFGGKEPTKTFDILSICSGTKGKVTYLDVPPVFRPHWTKYVMNLGCNEDPS